MWLIKTNSFFEIQKVLRNWWHSRRPLVNLTHLFNHCSRLSHSPKFWMEAKVLTLPKRGKDPKFPQNLHPISLLSTTGKLFEKIILHIVQKYTEEGTLLNASQFGFRACHSTTLQFMRLTDHVTLNFNNNMSTDAVFLDIERPLITYGTLACYIRYLNWTFRPVWSSSLATFFHNANSVLR
jgi:hypothetical protein